ncbi:MAG: class I SAM-dependent methyltransferase [Chloroflexota bacterium]
MSEDPRRDAAANPVVERYDRDADRYGRHWAPVLDTSARALLARVATDVRRLPAAPVIVDVGTGLGVLALEALARWPAATVVATDASAGMLREAQATAARLGLGDDPRLRWVHAPAHALGLPDRSVDLVVSSFVFQLVPDRAAAFAEARRVLRPGGTLAFVTWLDRGEDYAPAWEFDEAVLDVGIEEDEPEGEDRRAGDFRSSRAAARELRAAGFRGISARPDRLTFRWSEEEYLAFKRAYEEDELFASLDAATADALVARARERWATLHPDDWTWRAELVSAVAFAPR